MGDFVTRKMPKHEIDVFIMAGKFERHTPWACLTFKRNYFVGCRSIRCVNIPFS